MPKSPGSLGAIERAVPGCRRCPELRAWCAEVARKKRRAFAAWDYWARPVRGFGDRRGRTLIVGLAPSAHGAECPIGDTVLLGCYHVSQQNTFTGRLTEGMMDALLTRAREVAAR